MQIDRSSRADTVGLSVGTLTTLALGMTMSFLCPVGALVGGAWLMASGAAAAGFGVGAIIGWSAAGGTAGYLLGRLVKPVGIWMAMGIGYLAGQTARGVTWVVDRLSRKRETAVDAKAEERPSFLRRLFTGGIKAAFGKAAHKKPANDNPPKPAPRRRHEPRL